MGTVFFWGFTRLCVIIYCGLFRRKPNQVPFPTAFEDGTP
jgi:hypothetical protein